MNYHNVTKDDMLNGDGLRVVLWVAGCEHHCPECQNPVTWNPEGGMPFDEAAKQEIFAELEKDYVPGITFSGGDPFHLDNRIEVAKLMQEIKIRYPDKTIWAYTGYSWKSIKNGISLYIYARVGIDILDYMNVCVCDKFNAEQRRKDAEMGVKALWRGDSHQDFMTKDETGHWTIRPMLEIIGNAR